MGRDMAALSTGARVISLLLNVTEPSKPRTYLSRAVFSAPILARHNTNSFPACCRQAICSRAVLPVGIGPPGTRSKASVVARGREQGARLSYLSSSLAYLLTHHLVHTGHPQVQVVVHQPVERLHRAL